MIRIQLHHALRKNIALGLALIAACGSADDMTAAQEAPPRQHLADVLEVEVSGDAGAYSFSVTVASPDSGCTRYADWWEVLSTEGELLYRRVLLHSHTDEQPFTRSGSPVPIAADQTVWVRTHMFPHGYGGAAMRGTPATGFNTDSLAVDFAASVAEQEPLPQDCAF